MTEPTADTPQEEIRAYLARLGDCLAAMGSIEDAGSPEANKQAWEDMVTLERKYDRIKGLLK